jgi:hypothetical protein
MVRPTLLSPCHVFVGASLGLEATQEGAIPNSTTPYGRGRQAQGRPTWRLAGFAAKAYYQSASKS